MPNKESDCNCTHKKLHIGNDYITLVYNDSKEDYKIGTIKVRPAIYIQIAAHSQIEGLHLFGAFLFLKILKI